MHCEIWAIFFSSKIVYCFDADVISSSEHTSLPRFDFLRISVCAVCIGVDPIEMSNVAHSFIGPSIVNTNFPVCFR